MLRQIYFLAAASLTGRVSALAILIWFAGCDTAVRIATREHKPMAYVGTVELGEPVTDAGQTVVPLKYTGGQLPQDSAIVPIEVDATVTDGEIEITVVTSVSTDIDARKGYELILPEMSKGMYVIYYRDPDGKRFEIGEIEITE